MSSPAFIFLYGGGGGAVGGEAQLDYMSQLSLRLSVPRDRELTNRDVGKSDFQAPPVQSWRGGWGGVRIFSFSGMQEWAQLPGKT